MICFYLFLNQRRAINRPDLEIFENQDILNKLAELLLEKETVMGNERDDLIRAMRIGIEFPAKIS